MRSDVNGSKKVSAPAQHANFSWWQEEHNFYLDLRAHIPLRMAALRIAEIVGAERRDDLIYLFRHELDDMAAGRLTYGEIRNTIVARRGITSRAGPSARRCPPCSAPLQRAPMIRS